MKKLILLLLLPVLILTGCSSAKNNEAPTGNYGKVINQLKDTETWKDKIEVKFYLLGVDKVDSYMSGFNGAKKGQEIIAVRYELKNLSDKDINMTGFNFGNAGFDNPTKPVGTFNYSQNSLHEKLKFPTFPEEWSSTGKWILPAGKTLDVSFDWIVENKNYKMFYYWLMPFDSKYTSFDVTFKP